MSRIIEFEGTEHEFPDDFSDQDISRALSNYDKKQQFEKFKSATEFSPSNLASKGISDIAGGLLKGIYNTAQSLPTVNTFIRPLIEKATGENKPKNEPDIYKLMGTEEKPFYTPGGALQLLGEMGIPAKSLPSAPSLAKGGMKLIKEGLESIQPSKKVSELLEHISSGLPHTQASTKAITNDIRNAYQSNLQQSISHLNFPLEQAGNEKIYTHIDPLITTKLDKSKPLIDKIEGFNVGELLDKFKSDPTLQNAHNLKSELGDMIGEMKRIPGLNPSEKLQLENIRNARETLKSHIKDYLRKRDESSNQSLLPHYELGSSLYEKNVSPYLHTKKLREIVKKGKTNVKNIHNIFESPYDIVEGLEGKEKTGPINKILSDLPSETKDKLLFNKIGGRVNKSDSQKLLKSLEKSEQQGYSHLFTEKTKKLINELNNRVSNKRKFKFGAGTAGAGAIATGIEEMIRNLISNK